ncbi:MAG: efflux RND transporter periplasmic adaptor subunit [Acidobacteria bacterium]|nr:MAG: efflux RND transporter periplasmic adaptor subunit [Acidobacteriota bacterium]
MIKRLVFIVIAVGTLTLLAFRVTEALKDKQEAAAPRAGGMRPAVVVKTAKVEMARFEEAVELTGELRALAQVNVGPKISGRLSEVLVDNGDYVKKGQILARIDDQEIEQQVIRSRASLRVAEAGLKQDQANLENLKSQLRRSESLYADRLVSLQSLEDLRSQVLGGEAQAELGEAQINQARAELRELEIQLEQTRLYAPMSGYVGERTLHPGALVTPSSSILSVLDLSRLKTIVAAPEQHLRKLRVGLTARVAVDAYPNESFSGAITRISPMLDPETRAAEVEIIIPNRQSLLKAGMFVRAAVVIRNVQSLAIPRESLVTRENQQGVFVIEEGKAHYLPVQIGISQQGRIQILDGIEPGREVVAAGSQFLNEGDPVRLPGERPGRPAQGPVGGGRRNPS